MKSENSSYLIETPSFSRVLNRFQKEDPTFKVHIDHESKQVGISVFRLITRDLSRRPSSLVRENFTSRSTSNLRGKNVTSNPQVAFRKTITQRAEFVYMHKKQTGGAGQYARVIGYIEPMEVDPETGKDVAFESVVMGGNIPSNYIPAVEKVFRSLVIP